jgi:hypothetical protein
MPGVKGRSGGPRPNTGPKPGKISTKPGDSWFVSTVTPEGPIYPSEVWTVERVERSVIVLRSNTGDVIRMVR